jgi:arabinogalactan oligomer/maltooligosaccharide transport system substrate-binding protein
MSQRHRLIPRWPWLTAALAVCLVLSACLPRWTPPRVLLVGLGVGSEELLSAELVKEVQERFRQLERSFQQIYPNSSIRFNVYREAALIAAIRERTWAGLAPDLLLVHGDTAHELFREGLIDPFPATAAQLKASDPSVLRRMRSSSGALIGLPMLEQTQLACFNRQRLPQSPASVDQLLAVSAAGHPIGLPASLPDLFWTAGSLGALPGLNRALDRQSPTPAQRAGIETWLAWLQNANSQQWVIFYLNLQGAETALLRGQLDWMPCRSTMLPGLSKAMGTRLGVTPLPAGVGFQPSPINQLRLLTLARHGSSSGRQLALEFSGFAMNNLIQREITLGSKTFLPANRFVRVPVLSSEVLDAMLIASQQGRSANHTLTMIHRGDPRVPELQALINDLVFGDMSPRLATTELIRILRDD